MIRLKRLIVPLLIAATLALSSLGARDVVTRLVFPDAPISLDPLQLLGARVEAAYIPTVIKSLQYGTLTVTGATSNTATITAVDTTKCGVQWLGFAPTGGGLDNSMGTKLVLTNSTTLTATLAAVGTSTTKFVVVCFVPNLIKSIQRGNALTASSTVTITSVNTAKTILSFLGRTMTTTNTNMGDFSGITLTNATTITSNSTTNAGTISWEAWEFN